MADPENQKKQSRLAVALICVLAGLLFSPWIFTGRVLAPFDIIHQMFLPWRVGVELPDVKNHFVTDAVTQYIPYRIFAEQSFREDGYVGWNPLVFGGTPQYANTMALSFDWTIQLHRILPFWNAWHLGDISPTGARRSGDVPVFAVVRVRPSHCAHGGTCLHDELAVCRMDLSPLGTWELLLDAVGILGDVPVVQYRTLHKRPIKSHARSIQPRPRLFGARVHGGLPPALGICCHGHRLRVSWLLVGQPTANTSTCFASHAFFCVGSLRYGARGDHV